MLLVGHNNKEVPVRLTIEPCMVGKMRLLTATSERLAVAADAAEL